MANCCSTDIMIYSPDKDKLEKMISDVNRWVDQPDRRKYSDLYWIAQGAGDEVAKVTSDYCGSISHMDSIHKENGIYCVKISMEDAWTPKLPIWLKLTEMYLSKKGCLIYYADEPGCDILDTNDEARVGTYLVDDPDGILSDKDYWCDATEDELVPILQAYLSTNETDFETLFDEFQEKHFDEDASVWLRKWAYTEATAWH